MKLMTPALVSEVAPVTPAEAPPMLLIPIDAAFVTVRLVSADPPPITPPRVTVPPVLPFNPRANAPSIVVELPEKLMFAPPPANVLIATPAVNVIGPVIVTAPFDVVVMLPPRLIPLLPE